MRTKVLSVGGSIIAPDKPDVEFLAAFSTMAIGWLTRNTDARLVLVAGGGGPARTYQAAYREVAARYDAAQCAAAGFLSEAGRNEACDWLGIMATRMNAQLLKTCFGPLCTHDVVTNPTESPEEFEGRVLVAAGWKPGFSTDNDAVLLAEKYGADTVVNLSNIEKVYTDDPRTNPAARPLDTICWQDFRAMVGDAWEPGKNCPFDPVASRRASELGLTVICAAGKNIANIQAILNGGEYAGTTIR